MKAVLFISLLFLLVFFYSQQINLMTADLGRHIRNGEAFVERREVISTNYYSYTEPNKAVLNHHWGVGVVFYQLYACFGFWGISAFYIGLMLLACIIFFVLAQRLSNFYLAYILSVLNLPLIVSRLEIRPEGFSYLFLGLFLLVLFLVREGKCSQRYLWGLCLLQLLWVNMHIFFIFGPMLVVCFWLDEWLRGKCGFIDQDKKRLHVFAGVVGGLVVASCLNPYGIFGALTPFNILKEYGYMLAENQSVLFMQKRFSGNMLYVQFEIVFTLMVLVVLALSVKMKKFQYFVHVMLLAIFSCLAWRAVRGISLFGFMCIPIGAHLLFMIFKEFRSALSRHCLRICALFAFGVVFCGLFYRGGIYNPYRAKNLPLILKGESLKVPFVSVIKHFDKLLGLMPQVNASAQFFQANHLKGPIFNNYDIGGYLIFHLFPEEKVFVDNRPEAYRVPFFKEKYVPMQEDELIWQTMDQEYGFNVIYFYRLDMTPWAQPFLIQRISDPLWVPVFVDAYSIILLKRNSINQSIINQYALPKSMFVVTK